MPRMCIISDQIFKPEGFNNPYISFYSWIESNEVEISSYELVVFDQRFGDYSLTRVNFENLSSKVFTHLNSSGILICLTYFTLIDNERSVVKEYGISGDELAHPIGAKQNRHPLSYDWMNEHAAAKLGLLDMSKGLVEIKGVVLPKYGIFDNYFKGVEECHKVLENIQYHDNVAFFEGPFLSGEKREFSEIEVSVIAKVKQTEKPVAAVIKEKNGLIVFLPQSNKEQMKLILDLHEIGSDLYHSSDKALVLTEDRPSWMKDHISNYENNVKVNIEKMEVTIENSKEELQQLNRIDRLLYAKGKPLENAVYHVFKELDFNFEKTPQGEHYDFAIENLLSAKRVFVEVTGEKKIKFGSRKLSQAQYLTEETSKTEDKILILINCQRDIDPKARDLQNMISEPALKIFDSLSIAIIPTSDLYEQWKLFKDGELTKDDVKNWFINQVLDNDLNPFRKDPVLGNAGRKGETNQ